MLVVGEEVDIMRRFLPLTAVAVMLLAWVAPAQAGKNVLAVYTKSSPFFEQAAKRFQQCLTEKKPDIAFEMLALPDDDSAGAVLEAAAAKKPDMILTIGSQATRLGRQKAGGVPVLYCMVVDPGSTSIGPGGVSLDLSISDQLDFLRRHFPQFKRVGVLYNPQKTRDLAHEFRATAQNNPQIVLQEVQNLTQLSDAIQDLKPKVDCLYMLSDPTIYTPLTSSQIILQTIRLNLPFIAISAGYVKAGALAGAYADMTDNGCQAADLAVRVLNGEDPASFGIVRPRRSHFSVNLVVAEQLGIIIKPSTISAAEQTIK
jgi:putative tryptophan/tyrosine transport system substrate-binding protein